MSMAKAHKVFEGLKVLDFGRIITGSLVSEYLAMHGATVVKVESFRVPDRLRFSTPYKDRRGGLNRSGYFSLYNANKFSLVLDLDHARAKDMVKRLVLWCDVLVENLAPGAMEKRGFGYEDVKRMKPDIIMLSASNMGRSGPFSSFRGFGYTLMALTGFTSLTGWPDRVPSHPFGALADFIAPCLATIVLIGALEYRRRTGKGQYLDVSQYECSLLLLSPVLLDYIINGRELSRKGNRCPHAAPHGAYPCKGEDRWCVIAVESEEEWLAFCNLIGKPEMARDARFCDLRRRKENETELDETIALWTKGKSAEEIMDMLQGAGLTAGVVQNPADIFQDPQLIFRNHFQMLEHPEMGYHNYEMPPFRLSSTPAKLNRPAPCIGQDNEYVCRQLLCMEDDEFISLLNEGVFE